MKGFIFVLAVLFLFVGVGYALFGKYPPYFKYRFELALDVAVDGKVVTGAAVYEVASSKFGPLRFGEGPHVSHDWQGSALTVDLGARGLLFVTRFNSNCRESSEALALLIPKISEDYQRPRESEIPLASLPLLMRFRDINDRDSLVEVNPNDLAAAFGPKVKLLRARFKTSDASITPIPATWPRWLVKAEQHLYEWNANKPCAIPFLSDLFKYE